MLLRLFNIRSQLNSRQKKKGHRISPAPRVWYPPPVLGNCYGSTVNATQAPLVVTGVLPVAPASKRMTPSSLEQKSRTPDWLKVSGEAPTVYPVLIPPAPATGVTA